MNDNTMIELQALIAECRGMEADNQYQTSQGEVVIYTHEDFYGIAEAMRALKTSEQPTLDKPPTLVETIMAGHDPAPVEPPTVVEILAEWLTKNGYDGLVSPNVSCRCQVKHTLEFHLCWCQSRKLHQSDWRKCRPWKA